MGQNDEDARREAREFLQRAIRKKSEESHNLYQAEQVEVAQKKAKVALWRWVEKRGVPFLGWAIAGGVAIIVLCLLATGIAYIFHILGMVTLARIVEVKSLLGNIITFLGGAVSTSFLFLLTQKPRQ